VSWRRIGAVNDRLDWVANALEFTFVDPSTWIEDGDFARDGLHLNGRGKRRLGKLYARVSGLDDGASTGRKMLLNLEYRTNRMRKTREKRRPSIEEQKTLHEESGLVINNLMSKEVEVGARGSSLSVASAYSIESKSLVVLQVNCRSIYNKALEFWTLVGM
jgi:hypothetical protein